MKLGLFCGVLLGLTALSGPVAHMSAQGLQKPPAPAPANHVQTPYRGGLLSPPQPKPSFTLTDTSGASYDFRTKTQGYVALLFFGYTHCPDMCPLQMYMIAQALKTMPAAGQDKFRVVFVTTDPDRDSPAVLRAWLDRFDKRFIGLTGSQQAIDAAQIAANVPPAKKSAVRSDGAYEVGHAAFVFAYTRDNLAHLVYPVGFTPLDWSHDLPLLASASW